MKHIISLLLLFTSTNVFSQNITDSALSAYHPNCNISDDEKIFSFTEIRASFPLGEDKLNKYFKLNINTRAFLNNGAPKGKYSIKIKFIVKKDGTYCELQPVSSNGFGMEEEAIRLLKTLPKWNPALQNNRIVSAYFIQQIDIKL